MWFFYLFALIPLIIGLFIWIFNKKITVIEWICGSFTAFLLAGIMQCVAFFGMTDDIETWSGYITHISHFPQWVEHYTEIHTETTTDSEGKVHVRVYTDSHDDTHEEQWIAYLNYGTLSQEKDISLDKFNEIKANFGGLIEDGGLQPFHHGGRKTSGDRNIYVAPNKTGYIYPVTTICHFENRIKAAPTVFSFATVPTNIPVYEWPQNPNWLVSDRLLGEGRISILEFDRMNSRLGPKRLINVIMINHGNKDSSIANWQQAKLVGGKKNDLVLCYGQVGTNGLPAWSKVFGWTESEIVKRNIETILLQNVANNDILKLIENEINKSYTIKDWSRFDYIKINPPMWSYLVYMVLLCISQIGLWIWFNVNEFEK